MAGGKKKNSKVKSRNSEKKPTATKNSSSSAMSSIRTALMVLGIAVVVGFVFSVYSARQDENIPGGLASFMTPRGDVITKNAMDFVDANEKLKKVKMDLPSIADDNPDFALKMNTANFMEIINNTEGKAVLVSFFDPRSESYLVTRRDMDKAAKAISNDDYLKGKALIGMVNVAVDSYLQHTYSPETLASWQENTKEEKNDDVGFLFGKRNYFPIITKLFRNGMFVREYTDVIRPLQILSFLKLEVADNCTLLNDPDTATSFVTQHKPSLVGCFPQPWNELDGRVMGRKDEPYVDSLEVEAGSFYNMTWFLHGWFYYGYISNPELCKSLHNDLTPGSMLVTNQGGHMTVFDQKATGREIQEVHDFQRSVLKFLRVRRDPVLIEMTPDNSWDIIRNYQFIVILLVDWSNQSNFDRSQEIIETASYDSRISQDDFSLKFCYADARNFAGQFQLTLQQTPNLVMYMSGQDMSAVFHNGTDNVGHEMLLDADKETSVENVVKWIKSFVGDPPLVQKPETTSAVINPIEASVKRRPSDEGEEEEGAEDVGEEGINQEMASKVVDDIMNEAQNPEKTKPKAPPAVKRSWRSLRKIDVQHVMRDPNGASLSSLWKQTMNLYQEVLLFEESYQNMSPKRRQNAENIELRRLLDLGMNHMKSRKHWRLMVDTMPITPAALQQLSQDEDLLHNFWVNIQKLSTYKQVLFKEVEDLERPHRNETMLMFAEDYSFMWNLVVDIHFTRSDTFLKRFRKEHGRDPVVEDIQVKEIDRRSANDLSLEEFINDYAKARRPVIITDLKMFKTKWTKEHIAEKCGSETPSYVKKDATSHNWGGLVPVNERVNLTTFLETHNKNETRKEWYLHDWGLPRYCPNIMGQAPFDEFIYPKYFAGDYFQRMPFVGYQHSWPSLFVGANGTESSMHIDSGGTNFWMYLIEGVKEWRFYDRFDKLELYAEPNSPHFYADVFRPNVEEQPLLLNAPVYSGTQMPGELVFIPGGCPHGVRNFDDIVGISMNYLDYSNEFLYLWIQIMDEDYRDYELYANPAFPRGLMKNQKDLTLGEFKSQEWYKMADKLDLK